MILSSTIAAGLGVTHALLGPDHYVPFAALALARGWRTGRALAFVLAGGVLHVAAGAGLGAAALAVGTTVERWAQVETAWGTWTTWGLILFGLLYMVWGLRQAARRNVPARPQSAWTWAYVFLFVFGPCEPLVPLIAASHLQNASVLATILYFTAGTLLAMAGAALVLLLAGRRAAGVSTRWAHAGAGAALALTGVAVKALGL